MYVMHTNDEIHASNLVFSHFPTLLHANGSNKKCSLDVNNTSFFSSIVVAHDQRYGARHKGRPLINGTLNTMKGALREWETINTWDPEHNERSSP